jgi:hypothetical protein
MTDKKRPPIAHLIEAIVSEGDLGKTQLALAESQARMAELFGNELTRFRAWECLLYLFFTRYYLKKENPLGLIKSDQDFLTNTLRGDGQYEETAKQIEKIYSQIGEMVMNYRQSEIESNDATEYNN